MEDQYKTSVLEANRLAEIGDNLSAIVILQNLIDDPKLPVTDRAMMALNKAILLGRVGRSTEALNTYDEAMALENSGMELFIREQKAVYLNETGRSSESLAMYKSLLEAKDIKAEDRQRVQSNIASLEESLKKK